MGQRKVVSNVGLMERGKLIINVPISNTGKYLSLVQKQWYEYVKYIIGCYPGTSVHPSHSFFSVVKGLY